MELMNKTMQIISLGAGVQSSTMALMAVRGELTPMPDAAIFADTQWEPKAVYEHLSWLEKQLPFPVYRVTAGDIRKDNLSATNSTGQSFTSMPFYTTGKGMGRRQCTREYKIAPIRKQIRKLLDIQPRKHVPKGTQIFQWIGISTDESMRMKPSRDSWITHRWPLIENNISRNDCLEWFGKHFKGRKLTKSACIGCPFHDDRTWLEMSKQDPSSWADALEFDEIIRQNKEGVLQYIHPSRKPLSEVGLVVDKSRGQIDLFNGECEGMCGI